MKGFELIKHNALGKEDQSRAGDWDPLIKPVCDLINTFKNYCTTSSCSGRIIITEHSSNKKCDTEWLLVKHDNVTFEEVNESLKKIDGGEVWFHVHPFILHIACKTIEDAFELLKLFRNSGFKRVGINGPKKNVIEIIGTDRIELPIGNNGELLIQEDYLRFLVNESNKKFIKNIERIDKLFNALVGFSERK